MSVLTILNLTFREAWRKKLFWLAFGLGLAFIILFGLGFHFIVNEITSHSSEMRQGGTVARIFLDEVSGVFLVMGLFAVNVLIVMMTVLVGVGAVSGEIDSHTIQTIAAKPIHRWQIIIGKWLGFALMLVLYVVFMAGGLTTVVALRTGYWPPNFLSALGLLVLEGLVVLSVVMLGGTLFSTLANGVFSFMLYGVAFVGGWVEQIGAALDSQVAVQVGIIASLIMPSEAIWRMASDMLQPTFVAQVGFSPIVNFSKPSGAMVVYAVIYLLVFLGLALYRFQKRDL